MLFRVGVFYFLVQIDEGLSLTLIHLIVEFAHIHLKIAAAFAKVSKRGW